MAGFLHKANLSRAFLCVFCLLCLLFCKSEYSYAYTVDDVRDMYSLPMQSEFYSKAEIETVLKNYTSAKVLEDISSVYKALSSLDYIKEKEGAFSLLEDDLAKAEESFIASYASGVPFEECKVLYSGYESAFAKLNNSAYVQGVGSEAMLSYVNLWSEDYEKVHSIQIQEALSSDIGSAMGLSLRAPYVGAPEVFTISSPYGYRFSPWVSSNASASIITALNDGSMNYDALGSVLTDEDKEAFDSGQSPVLFHSGIDIPLKEGTLVTSQFNGLVTRVWESAATGISIEVMHGEGLVTQYFHLSEVLVEPGAQVLQGYPIARSGSTGQSTGPHLHFSVLLDGDYVNPLYLYGENGAKVMRQYASDNPERVREAIYLGNNIKDLPSRVSRDVDVPIAASNLVMQGSSNSIGTGYSTKDFRSNISDYLESRGE